MERALIEIEGVTAAYDEKIVLQNVNLTVYEKDFLGIIGPNGGGKTTLVRIMLGLKHPQSGRVKYFHQGKQVNEIAIGYLPQYSSIDKKFPISVSEVVISGLVRHKPLFCNYTAEQRLQVTQALERLEIGYLSSRNIGTLSGGQLQRVLLARAIVSNPEVVVLDEPNTYIDKRFQEQMYKILVSLNTQCAIVIVSHDIGSVMQNVRNVACVDHDVHYHSVDEVTDNELEALVGCPIDLLGHGSHPHRVLKRH